MNRARTVAAGLTLGVLVAAVALRSGAAREEPAAPAAPPGWPMFGNTPQRNLVNTWDRNIATSWSVTSTKGKLETGKNIKWVAALGSRSYGGPVIAGGKIFVGTNNQQPRDPKIKGDRGILMCFRESDGAFLWQIVHDKLPSGQVNDWPQEGVCAHPVVDGDWLYYVSNRCELVCADTATGKIVWLLDMMKDLGVFPHNMAACSPLVVGDLVFAMTGNGVSEDHVGIPAPKAPSFVAVNKKSGKLVWQDNAPSIKAVGLAQELDQAKYARSALKRLVDQGQVLMHGQWSNPTYAVVNGKPQVIFPGGDGWLRAYEPATGKLIWWFDANPKDSRYELGGRGTRSDFIATPVVVENRLFIGTGQDPEHYEGLGHLWCIDMTKTGDVSPDLVVDDKATPVKTKPNPNSAVVWHYGGPTTKEDAETLQRDYYFGRTMSSMVVHNGLVYAAELAGYLYCLDARTGKRYWGYDIRAAVWGSPSWIDGKVYIGTEDGEVWIFKHGAFCELVARVEMPQPIRTTMPVAVNGVLYITTESHLYAIGNK